AGSAPPFGPLTADTSHCVLRRRGLAVSIVASGNYLAGTVWPPVLQHFIDTAGWRATHLGVGVFCAVAMLPLALGVRRRAPGHAAAATATHAAAGWSRPLGMSPAALQGLL